MDVPRRSQQLFAAMKTVRRAHVLAAALLTTVVVGTALLGPGDSNAEPCDLAAAAAEAAAADRAQRSGSLAPKRTCVSGYESAFWFKWL
jgi:hypothetical protein